MPSLRWDAVTVCCRDADVLASFWAELLRVEVRGRWEQYVGLEPVAPGLPRLVFQQVGEDVPAPVPSAGGFHLDLHVSGPDVLPAAVARALALGAVDVGRQEQGGAVWHVLADPEGNPFCLVSD